VSAEGESKVSLPPGWRLNDQGAWVRETIHHMGRRCRNWDYCGTGAYMITLVLNDRRSAVFGQVKGPPGEMVLSPLGEAIACHVDRLPEFSPELEVLAKRVMPDHLHLVLRVRRRLAKPLGEHLRGFKIGCTKIARAFGCSGIDAGARGGGLFADGFVDTILFDEEAVVNEIAYLADNPRRLWQKRAHPELFRVLRDLELSLPIDGQAHKAHFGAIGNQTLLRRSFLVQVQCSRSDFAYSRNAEGEIEQTAPPAVMTEAFTEKSGDLLAAAEHGAVLVDPCISHGEKEIARRAYLAGYSVITLQDKGFTPLYKPGGKLFDRCADGNLLMLAPAGWPYLPGRQKITRDKACVLNRLGQLLSGRGAAEIRYRGITPSDVERLVLEAVKAEPMT